jgi:hypothetical protein
LQILLNIVHLSEINNKKNGLTLPITIGMQIAHSFRIRGFGPHIGKGLPCNALAIFFGRRSFSAIIREGVRL